MSRRRIKWRRTEHASQEFPLVEVKIHFSKPGTIARGWFAAPHLGVNGKHIWQIWLNWWVNACLSFSVFSFYNFDDFKQENFLFNVLKSLKMSSNDWKTTNKGARLKALASVYFTSTSCFCPCPSSSQNQYNLSRLSMTVPTF